MKIARPLAVSAAIVASLPFGLAACAPAATSGSLSCTAVAMVTQPQQNTVESVTVTSEVGVRVQLTAEFRSGSKHMASLTNAQGGAQFTIPVGAAAPGQQVRVVVQVVKGASKGTCTTFFVPARQVATPKPSTLTASIAAKWMGVKIGDTWDGWAGVCSTVVHPRTGGGCGTVAVPTTLNGFQAYGGIATCPEAVKYCDMDSGPALTGSIRLQWQLRCNATGVITARNEVVKLGGEWGAHNTTVNSVSSRGADQAQLELAADLPFNADIRTCATDSTLLTLSATDIKLHLSSGSGFPAADFFAAGPFTLS